jgi:hypothetical protein
MGMFYAEHPYGFWITLGSTLAIILIIWLLAAILLSHPFRSMIEGKGILGIKMDSTGILKPFIINVQTPFIWWWNRGYKHVDIFDRETVYQISKPLESPDNLIKVDKETGKITITMDESMYIKGKFAMETYPCLIYNEQLRTILTKDWFDNIEKVAFTEHTILLLNRQIEVLSEQITNFARYVVDTLRPKSSWLNSKWVWIIIAIVFVILAAIFAPSIINALKGGASTAVQSATGGATVSPIQ